MNDTAAILSTFSASFLAALVEVVEAFTIVLAVSLTRGFRPALFGTGLALCLLVALVLLFGPLFALVPLRALQLIVGTAMLLFGMRWLRKAILRAAGQLAFHDEAAAFAREMSTLAGGKEGRGANYIAGIAAFKAVLLEGVEVVFIVIAVGGAHGMTGVAGLGALSAAVLVAVVGIAVHKPLSHVPENTIKFVVGIMLTSFGIFWLGEAIEVGWPGGDVAVLVLFLLFGGFSVAAVKWLRSGLQRREQAR
ncbi:hypothetical protein FJU08_06370 [Martelella alba]|uniref:GDT1 family protein n=1 Tax=Martelella alba TaxID=2590451 RepID=A0A506UGK2_9HYPH|nr:hypothetical protein [Martelella alba]TPW32611.1 hypothetical protein FJU08_06370 [Martelella alba]